MFGVDWMGLALPLAYLLVLSGALMSFSTIYRKRKAAESANLAPWFGPNLQRNVYLSLLHLGPEDGGGDKPSPRVPDSVLRAALLRRAVQDIERLIQIKSAKQACSTLLLRGSVGDDLWQRFQRAEKEMEEELRDVVTEANALAPNWGPTIFQSAHEIAANARLRQRLDEIQSQTESEKQWWEKRRGQIQSDFMKELDDSEKSSTKATSEDDGVLIDTPGRSGKKGKK
ncbi:preprotein translocase subunit sec66 domain-containing protein [Hirsutella rhossiliensis]|uniref:Preprotein translocase subunit sec66 domain-containing protein n=1 Tax=Hirsutella rhossiliensis TaxID=111463 RepID=A0A9P8ML98_9HYPO|nr:preprotein translocase subunit sec66 domain-containing protein [Hirsutella rhossiliensis]KAH0957407.1 preprotein translocase subunit sec66 domain-containing protein [Hirsutella rhossiliensis]